MPSRQSAKEAAVMKSVKVMKAMKDDGSADMKMMKAMKAGASTTVALPPILRPRMKVRRAMKKAKEKESESPDRPGGGRSRKSGGEDKLDDKAWVSHEDPGEMKAQIQNLKPGCLIECKFFSKKSNELGTALFRLHEMESDRSGLLTDAEFIAASNPQLKDPLQIINLEPTGKPLHLCVVTPSKCVHKNGRHASVWRHRSVNRLGEDWVSDEMRKCLKRPFQIKQAYDAPEVEEVPLGFDEKEEHSAEPSRAPSNGVKPLLPQDGKRQGGAAVMERLKTKLDAAGQGPAGQGPDAAGEAPAGKDEDQAAAEDGGADDLPEVPEDAKAKIAELRAKLAEFKKEKEKKEGSKKKSNLLMELAARKRKAEDPGATDDEAVLDDKKKKDKKKKKKKKKKKSSSSSPEESSSDSSDVSELFRDPSSRRSSLSSRLQRVAKKEPGKLLRKTLEVMWEQLKPGQPMKGGQRTPPIVMAYLRDQLKSKELKGRNLVELTTIGMAADHMLKGELEQAVELLLQRFKSVEALATGSLPSEASRYLELIPPQAGSCLIDEEREEAMALQKSWKKYQKGE